MLSSVEHDIFFYNLWTWLCVRFYSLNLIQVGQSVMHQSFATLAMAGLGNSGDFDIPDWKTPCTVGTVPEKSSVPGDYMNLQTGLI